MYIFSVRKLNKFLGNNFKVIIFLAVFSILAWSLLSFKITDVPPGINGDEAAIGYNAALVARTNHDQSGRFLPLFVSAFDLNDWKQPITFYSTVLAFKIFNPSFVVLREVSVIFVLISAILIFLLGREVLGLRGALVSLFIFITIPAVLIQSHLALENIAPVPFVILWLWMLSKYQKSFHSKYLFLSAISLGVSLFTYPGMRIVFPVFTALSVIYIIYLNNKRKKIISENLKFLIVVLFFPIVMFSVKNQYPGAILAYNRPNNIQSYQDFFLPYISSFDPSFLFIQGDSTPYHSTGKQGVFLLATLPLFALGIFRIAQKKDPMLVFLLLTFFLAPLLYGLPASIHRGSRLLVLLPPYTIIAALGFLSILEMKNRLARFLITSVVILAVILNYADFLNDYWYIYPERVKEDFAKPIHKAFEKESILSRNKNLQPLIQKDLYLQNPTAADFFGQVYFPKTLKKWTVSQDFPKSSIAIVNPGDISPEIRAKVEAVKVENTNFEILINFQ